MKILYIVQLAALWNCTNATWISKDNSPVVGKLNVVENAGYDSRGISQYQRSLLKHNISPYTKREVENRDTDNANIPATFNGGRYLVPLVIGAGSNAETFALELDTGSPDLWVLSSLTATSEIVGQHTIYQPNTSTSAVLTNRTWGTTYSDGSGASGVVYEDTIILGGIEIQNQAVEVVEQLSGILVGASPDGVLGLSLAVSHITPGGVLTTLENLFNHPLNPAVFTAALRRPSEPVKGFYTFGYIDEELVPTPLQYTDVIDTNGFWEFPSTSATIGGNVTSRPGNTAIADTGTTLILVDDVLLENVYGPIGGYFNSTLRNGQGAWLFPNTLKAAEQPTITLPFGDFAVTLYVGDLEYEDLGDGWVFGSLQSRRESPRDIFGDIWLANLYVVFDGTIPNRPRLGVVPRAYGT
jgi:Eukaryotic aspartyl protease